MALKLRNTGEVDEKFIEHRIVFSKLRRGAVEPEKSNQDSAGFDLCCDGEIYTIPGRGSCVVSTGLQMLFPRGLFGIFAIFKCKISTFMYVRTIGRQIFRRDEIRSRRRRRSRGRRLRGRN